MSDNFLRTVSKNGNSLCVTIPKDSVKHLKLEVGMMVRVNIEKAR